PSEPPRLLHPPRPTLASLERVRFERWESALVVPGNPRERLQSPSERQPQRGSSVTASRELRVQRLDGFESRCPHDDLLSSVLSRHFRSLALAVRNRFHVHFDFELGFESNDASSRRLGGARNIFGGSTAFA